MGGPSSTASVSRQHETAYYGYYGYAPYWAGDYLWGAAPYPSLGTGPVPRAAELAREQRWSWAAKAREDPHLRSAQAVTGYYATPEKFTGKGVITAGK